MTGWISFDEPAADAVQNAGRQPALRSGDALTAAVRDPGNSVVILPTGNAQELALLTVMKRERVAAPVIEFTKRPKVGQATGFLGLTDEPEFENEPEKKPWWKKW